MQLTNKQYNGLIQANKMLAHDRKQALTRLVTYVIIFSLVGLFIAMLSHNDTAITNLINK